MIQYWTEITPNLPLPKAFGKIRDAVEVLLALNAKLPASGPKQLTSRAIR